MLRPPISLDRQASHRAYWAEHHLFRHEKAPVTIRREHQSSTALHRHEFVEFVLVLSGTAVHDTGALIYDLVPGELLVIAGHRAHAYRNVSNLEILNILIRRQAMDILDPMLRDLPGYERVFGRKGQPFHRLRPLLPGSIDRLLQIVRRMEEELERMDAGSPPLLMAMLTELLVAACRLAEDPDSGSLHRSQIGKLITYLEQHYGEPVDLARMQSVAGMSARTLQRQFTAVTRTTPLRYLLRLRLTGACRLLRETDMKSTEIAARCGIPDPAYFSRLFTQTIGVTPRAYRNRLIAARP